MAQHTWGHRPSAFESHPPPPHHLRLLDADLAIASQLGLLEKAGVPEDHRKEYGEDTVWPTALVVDRNGMIVYSYLSKSISDRPDAKVLLQALAKAQSR